MSFTTTIVALISLLYTTASAATSRQSFLATFDDLPKIEGFSATAHISTPYLTLGWTNWFVASPGNSILVPPHSGSAGALAAIDAPVVIEPPSIITVKYPGSEVKSFDLLSTWVACATRFGEPAERCVVRFVGHMARGNGTVNHDCGFGGKETMEFCRLGRGFRGLESVEVSVAVATSAYGQAAQLDDVRGVVYR